MPVRRLGYRFAYAGLRLYWLLVRPEVSGVKCVLTDRERVLLVRHSYGSRGWDLPGGTIKRGEDPEATASREMNEELGVSIDRWRSLGVMALTIDHRRDQLHCFQAELNAPEIEIDRGELLEARWFRRDQLPDRLGRYTNRILARLQARA